VNQTPVPFLLHTRTENRREIQVWSDGLETSGVGLEQRKIQRDETVSVIEFIASDEAER
jgi:hypothetical protein